MTKLTSPTITYKQTNFYTLQGRSEFTYTQAFVLNSKRLCRAKVILNHYAQQSWLNVEAWTESGWQLLITKPATSHTALCYPKKMGDKNEIDVLYWNASLETLVTSCSLAVDNVIEEASEMFSHEWVAL